jgi:hypothetical protein
MSDVTGKYRSMLDGLQKTARQVVMDEIEGEVGRLLSYAQGIDMTDKEAMSTGIETIVAGLKELAQKVY